MALQNPTVRSVVTTGLNPTYAGSLSTSDTYQCDNDGKVWIHFKKANAVDCTVTFLTPATAGRDGLAIAELTVTVPASGGERLVGPFEQQIFNNSSGKLQWTLSDVDGLTMMVCHLG